MSVILVLGATGYVGSRLVPQIVNEGHQVRCLVRDPQRLTGANTLQCEIVEGDLLRTETLSFAFSGVEIVYYLVHSMRVGEKEFADLDRAAARNVVLAAERAGVQRIIYLGGLGRRDIAQSPHLRSRHEVGDILRSGNIAVTELRAAVILGSGSASFEMMHHLVNRLPIMICPRWVIVKTQPIAIDDVLRYLVETIGKPETIGKIIDIGGPEILSYREMMLRLAAVLGLRRFLIQVPVLTPRLSSYWVNFVTPIPSQLAGALIESLRHETVCENTDAGMLFAIRPVTFEVAVYRALSGVLLGSTIGASTTKNIPQTVDPSHILVDQQIVEASCRVEVLFDQVKSIGGEKGWYYANWLWQLRGILDKMVGGVGMRRGRRDPVNVRNGDIIDFWKVEQYETNILLSLRAEMKVWGVAWLDFTVDSIDAERSRLTQTARYYPKGVTGLVYWWTVYPLHTLIFRNMSRKICRAAEMTNSSYNKIR